jgi:hypothetical protein
MRKEAPAAKSILDAAIKLTDVDNRAVKAMDTLQEN